MLKQLYEYCSKILCFLQIHRRQKGLKPAILIKAIPAPRFSLSAKTLVQRKSAAAQKDRWVIFKIADENLMYLYCHALLKRNTSRQAGVSFWTPLCFKLLIEINSRCSAVRKSTPTQQSARQMGGGRDNKKFCGWIFLTKLKQSCGMVSLYFRKSAQEGAGCSRTR